MDWIKYSNFILSSGVDVIWKRISRLTSTFDSSKGDSNKNDIIDFNIDKFNIK